MVAVERLYADEETRQDNPPGSLLPARVAPCSWSTRSSLRQEELDCPYGKAHTGQAMAPPLADFQGDAIYVDTNVLVGLVDATSVYHLACVPFFQRAVDHAQPYPALTATLTLDEVRLCLTPGTSGSGPLPHCPQP